MMALLLAAAFAFPMPCSYQANASAGGPLIVGSGIDTAAVKERARWPRLVLDIAPFGNLHGISWPQVPALIHTFNPRAEVLGYIQTNSVWFPPGKAPSAGFWQDFYYCMMHFNAWLYAPDGTLHDTWNVNWGNKAFADSMATLLQRQRVLGIWNGLFLDSWMPTIKWSGEGVNERIDYKRAGFANGDQMDSARTVNMARVVARLRASGIRVWINSGGQTVTNIAGDMREGFDAELITPTDAVAWIRTPGKHWLKAEYYGGMYDAEACRIARYSLGVSCLGTDGSGACMLKERAASGWFDEYSVDYKNRSDSTGAFTGWLGAANGDPTEVTPGVWLRYFDHGAVIVNTTKKPQLVWTWRQLWRIKGTHDPLVNSGQPGIYFFVPGSDALFLKSEPVAAAPEPILIPGRFMARAQPNPTRGHGEIVYALNDPQNVTVHLFDPAGRVAATLLDGVRQQAGEHRVEMGNQRLPPGLYYFRVRAGDQQAEGPVVIVR